MHPIHKFDQMQDGKSAQNNIIASNIVRFKSSNRSDSCLGRSVNSLNLSSNGNKFVYMECLNNVIFFVYFCVVCFFEVERELLNILMYVLCICTVCYLDQQQTIYIYIHTHTYIHIYIYIYIYVIF